MSQLSERLTKFNSHLLPDMVQLKYQLMAQNAFRFFRGTCHLFYEDLSTYKKLPPTPVSWICGDLHLENFGSFKGNNRMVYFDLNDFDEAVLAPVSWEITRLLTSIFTAFGSLNIPYTEAKAAATLFLSTYSDVLSKGKAYYIDPRTATGIIKSFLKAVKKRKEAEMIKYVLRDKDILKININHKTHFELDKALKKVLVQHITHWIDNTDGWPKNYTVRDAAFRVAGTGSVGLKRYMFLLQGIKNKKKFVLMEMKEAVASSLSPYNPVKQPAWILQAERVVTIKQRMQNVSPALLSHTEFKGDSYVIQEMQPTADKIKFELIEDRYKDLNLVIKDMAMLTASAQIRSGGIQGSAIIDELMVFGKRNDWQEALLQYAVTYARQAAKYYNQYLLDYNKGVFTPA